MSSYDVITNSQQEWAHKFGVQFDANGYVADFIINMLGQRLSDQARREYGGGAGRELKRKMCALHSSSALACNVFDYWRIQQDRSTIFGALGLPQESGCLQFEMEYRTGLGGTPPTLDAVVTTCSGKVLAIESKLREPYRHDFKGFRPSYFEEANDCIWTGIRRCKRFAERLADQRDSYDYLEACQLIKHIIGLTRAYGPRGFTLLYLWYDTGLEDAIAHRKEIESFAKAVGNEVNFRSLTYQKLFKVMVDNPAVNGQHQDYIQYLRKRYFPKIGQPV